MITIIGGSSYVGSEISRKFKQAKIIDTLRIIGLENEFIGSEILDVKTTMPVIANSDVVIWCPVLKDFVYESDSVMFETKIITELNYIISMCKRHDVRFIFLSDWHVYGNSLKEINDERFINPNSDYSVLLAYMEEIIRREHPLSTIIRLGEVWGESLNIDIDTIPNRTCFQYYGKRKITSHPGKNCYVPIVYIGDVVNMVTDVITREISGVTIDCYYEIYELSEFYKLFSDKKIFECLTDFIYSAKLKTNEKYLCYQPIIEFNVDKNKIMLSVEEEKKYTSEVW